MLAPAIVFLGAIYLTFRILSSLHQAYHHRKKAKALGCQPPNSVDTGILGITGFYRIAKAAREKRWVEYIAEHYQTSGPTFRQRALGGLMVTNTVEPENIKALLATQFQDFGLGTRHREFYPLLGNGIFTLDGAGWSHARGMLRPQFTRDQVADLDLMDGHITKMMDLIPKDGSTFDIQRLFFLLTIDSATHFLFGESVGSMRTSAESSLLEKSTVGNAQGFAEAFNRAQEYLAARSRAMAFYWLVNPKEFREANQLVHEVVDHYVRLALEAKRHPEKKEPGRYIFAEALAGDTDDPRVIRDNMLNILLAGRDTTASLLSSAFFYLARHPNVWTRLRQTIVDEFGDAQHPKGTITHARLKDTPYLRYFLNEGAQYPRRKLEYLLTRLVLRLLPPVPLNFRVAAKDTSLPLGGGPDGKAPIYVRKGELVSYSVYAMHRRTDLYGPDAHAFRPERWEENSKRGWEYLPFNGGPRICLGQQYALTEASYTMVKLLQRYNRIENADPDMVEPIINSSLTLSHDRGVHIRLFSS